MINSEEIRLRSFRDAHKEKACAVIQGLGFVGAAMAAVLAGAKNSNGVEQYCVVGVDQDTDSGMEKIDNVRNGVCPIVSTDKDLELLYKAARLRGNLTATSSSVAYEIADIVVVDINLDVIKKVTNDGLDYEVCVDAFLAATLNIVQRIRPGTLLLIESTVPPGYIEKLLIPKIYPILKKRQMGPSDILIGHCYERVTPGSNYVNSIINTYRVYSGVDDESKLATRRFLESFVNVKEWPLTELPKTTASELAKVLENSYRAANIAFVQEWTELADVAGVDLFEVIEAIRKRPTHRNLMYPGFGVGGYCLTKDAFLADWSASKLFGIKQGIKVSREAININDQMPSYTFHLMKKALGVRTNKTTTVFGASYIGDVDDLRESPSLKFIDLCVKDSIRVSVYDPVVQRWPYPNIRFTNVIENVPDETVAIILAVRHSQFLSMTFKEVIAAAPNVRIILDANNILSLDKALEFRRSGIQVLSIGRG